MGLPDRGLDNLDVRKLDPDHLNCRHEICVVREQKNLLQRLLVAVVQEMKADVDISLFFLVPNP